MSSHHFSRVKSRRNGVLHSNDESRALFYTDHTESIVIFCESLLSQLANKPKQTIAQRIETVITQTLTSIPKHRHLTESTETAKRNNEIMSRRIATQTK